MSIRLWELVAAVFVLLYAALQFSVGGIGVSIGIVAGTVIWLTTRVTILESDGRAGGYGRRTAWQSYLRVAFLYVAFIATVGVLVEAWLAHWQRTTQGDVAVVALLAIELLLAREIVPGLEEAINRRKGYRTEEAVGAELKPLSDLGWLVTHDWKKPRGGNVDHIVCGPGGAFAIETKSSRFRWRSLSQAAGNAAEIKKTLGVRWVQGVLCVDDPEQAPTKRDPVWVVSRQEIRQWLLAQHNKPVDTNAAAAALDVYLP